MIRVNDLYKDKKWEERPKTKEKIFQISRNQYSKYGIRKSNHVSHDIIEILNMKKYNAINIHYMWGQRSE